ncbi:MAG: hypothetical protein ACP5DZ_02080 [Bacteroidales bacterium]
MKYLFLLPLALIFVTLSCTKEDQEVLQQSNKITNASKDTPFITCIKSCQCPDSSWSSKCDVCAYHGFCNTPTVCDCRREGITTDTTEVFKELNYLNQKELKYVVDELYKGKINRELIINYYDIFIELSEKGFMANPDELINTMSD